MSGHALLSPSAAHRWLHCTAAPLREAQVPDQGSEYAREGSLAHAMAAASLKSFLGRNNAAERKEIEELEQYRTPEMEQCVVDYHNAVLDRYYDARRRSADAVLIIEKKVDASEWAPGVSGTADAIIISDGMMEVIDLKYGKGVEVSADHNPQMMIYALGAISRYDMEYSIDTVRMSIFQPRIGNYSSFEASVTSLIDWGNGILAKAAAEATAGSRRTQAGDWCKFCKVRGSCRALAEYCTEPFEKYPDPTSLTLAEIASDVLPRISTIKAWCGTMEEYALAKALGGDTLPGYKLVEGRSVRKITNPGELHSRLMVAGWSDSDTMKPSELRTLTELEKLIGKKAFAELSAGCVDKPAGKPTLVPSNDKRKEYKPTNNFENLNGN